MKTLERPYTNGHAKIEFEQQPPKQYWRRSYTAILAVLVAIAIAATSWAIFRPRADTSFVTVPVTQGTLAQSVTATGTVNPQDTVNVGTQVSGTIAQLNVDFNSKVRKGQVLARIDPTSLVDSLDSAKSSLAQSTAQAAAGRDSAAASISTEAADQQAVASAKSQIAKDQVAYALAQKTISRDRQLLSQGYIAQSQFDTDSSNAAAAQATLQAAQIAVAQAQSQEQAQVATAGAAASTATAGSAAIGIQQAAVAQAQYNLKNTVITSPVDGTVIARDISVGQTVAAGLQTPTLFAIAKDLTKMEVDVQVGEPDIGNVRQGDQVNFTVLAYPTRTFTGTVSQVRVNPTTVQNVVTYTTVVLVNNNDGALLPGMTANATINVASLANATIVPIAALQWHPTGQHAANAATKSGGASPWGSSGASGSSAIIAGTRGRVFVKSGAKLQMIPVSIQMVSGTNAAVTPLRGTLKAGDAVVISGGAATHARAAASNGSPLNARPTNVRVGGGGYGR